MTAIIGTLFIIIAGISEGRSRSMGADGRDSLIPHSHLVHYMFAGMFSIYTVDVLAYFIGIDFVTQTKSEHPIIFFVLETILPAFGRLIIGISIFFITENLSFLYFREHGNTNGKA